MYKLFLVVVLVCCLGFITGCASDMQAPGLKQAMSNPLDARPVLRKGLTKGEVLDRWGDPYMVRKLDDGQFNSIREEWIYTGRTDIPLDDTFSTKTTYLIFEDNALIEWSNKPAKVKEEVVDIK